MPLRARLDDQGEVILGERTLRDGQLKRESARGDAFQWTQRDLRPPPPQCHRARAWTTNGGASLERGRCAMVS